MPIQRLQPFKDIVSRRCGLMFDAVAEANLTSALAKRMEATGDKRPSGYFNRIITDDDEFHELVTLLTVNETYFFREPAQLAFLADILVPRLLIGRAGHRPIRILSAGCSTGEEPYSIAIALKEKFGESAGHLVSIAAADIDRRALDRARRADYGAFSFRALPAALWERHFQSRPGGRYRLKDEIRSMVAFHHLNLLPPVYPETLQGFDIVFYRNVSIYLDSASRKAILTNFYAAMTETGVLLPGLSETLANDLGVFHLVKEDNAFYFAKTPAPPGNALQPQAENVASALKKTKTVTVSISTPASAPITGPIVSHLPALRPSAPSTDWTEIAAAVRALLRDKRYDEALRRIAAGGLADPAHPRARLLEGHVRLQMRQFEQAAAIGREAVDQDSWSSEAHMLIALAAKWRGDAEAAIRSLKVIVYAKPNCWPAHYYLGTLLQDTDPVKARRQYATALRQVEADPDPDGGLWLPLDLPVSDIRFLCEHHGAARDAGDGGGR